MTKAVEEVNLSASDFLVKGDWLEILRNRVGVIYEQWLLGQENMELREKK